MGKTAKYLLPNNAQKLLWFYLYAAYIRATKEEKSNYFHTKHPCIWPDN